MYQKLLFFLMSSLDLTAYSLVPSDQLGILLTQHFHGGLLLLGLSEVVSPLPASSVLSACLTPSPMASPAWSVHGCNPQHDPQVPCPMLQVTLVGWLLPSSLLLVCFSLSWCVAVSLACRFFMAKGSSLLLFTISAAGQQSWVKPTVTSIVSWHSSSPRSPHEMVMTQWDDDRSSILWRVPYRPDCDYFFIQGSYPDAFVNWTKLWVVDLFRLLLELPDLVMIDMK